MLYSPYSNKGFTILIFGRILKLISVKLINNPSSAILFCAQGIVGDIRNTIIPCAPNTFWAGIFGDISIVSYLPVPGEIVRFDWLGKTASL